MIEFSKEPLQEEKMIYEVEDLIYFKNFEDVVRKIDIKLLASEDESIQNFLDSLNQFYKKEEQDKYGVVVIKLRKNFDFVIEKNYLSTISSNDNIFKRVKDNYANFSEWYLKLCNENEECYFTKKDNKVTSILILKINENDSQQIYEKNVLKIRTLDVLDNSKGIGKFYLKIVNDIALANNINMVYVTCKKNNDQFIKFIKNNKFKLDKEIAEEMVFIKEIL